MSLHASEKPLSYKTKHKDLLLMKNTKIEQQLGSNYNELILSYLASDRVITHGYSPTWWITGNNNWVGKSYWVRKALKELQASNQVESFKHHGGVGLCWALTGKMRRG